MRLPFDRIFLVNFLTSAARLVPLISSAVGASVLTSVSDIFAGFWMVFSHK